MNCPLCKSPAPHFLNAHDREYVSCGECGLISVPPDFHIPVKDEVARYREHENSLDNPGYVQMFEEKLNWIEQHAEPVRTVLDFGCGYEPVLKSLLEKRGYKASVYDPNFFPDWNRQARYDLIISTETFEHLKQPADEIERLLSVLKPEGYLAIMTRLSTFATGNLPDAKRFSGWYYARDPTHIIFFGLDTFQWIANRWNLEIRFHNDKDFVLLRQRT